MDPTAIARLVAGAHGEPFDVLGPHAMRGGGAAAVAVCAFLPEAKTAVLRIGKLRFPMTRLHAAGFFEATVPSGPPLARYRLELGLADGTTRLLHDPYAFPPVLTDFDLHLFGEGTNYALQTHMGAHVVAHGGVRGVSFAVWAPNALRVSVIGDFNRWDERRHPMRRRGASGIWELFIPGMKQGVLYKYHIATRIEGAHGDKADPLGFAMEVRPNTASRVWDLGRYRWRDEAWMKARAAHHAFDRPLSIYEVHLGSWRRDPLRASGDAGEGGWLTYRELARTLVPYAKKMGFTHLELMPVMEHPFDGSWGYQTVGYFAPTSRFGTPDDFRHFVDAAHRAGLGILLDWVPAHFPRDGHGLAFFDGTHLYEHADPRKGHHKDWDTFIYNYGSTPVVSFLLSNALHWLDAYHVDGLRVDAVASMLYLDYSRPPGEWVPNIHGGRENLEAVAFLKRLNELVKKHFPDVLMFAEESTSWPGVSHPVAAGGLGFDMKWNMGWMHDTLAYAREDPLARKHHHKKLTFSMMYAYSENFLLPLSHDEVVHGKRSLVSKLPGDLWKRCATLRLLLGSMWAHPGKKLLFMGGEIGQLREWHHDRQIDWPLLDDPRHRGLQDYVRELNRLLVALPALHEQDFAPAGFEWIDFSDEARSVVAFLRRARDRRDHVVVVANWTPLPRPGYRIGVPGAGAYRMLLNSDANRWGGSDAGLFDTVTTEPVPARDRAHSVVLTLPPLGILYLGPVPTT